MTSIAEPSTADTVAARREERLMRMLERAAASSRFNLSERWLFGLGGALVVAGFVVVVIGWAGASRTILPAGQIPYLMSGGLIGLGMVFVGGFLYFGHWLAVLVRESRERGAEDREDLALVRRQLEDLNRHLSSLAAVLSTGTVAAAPVNGSHPVSPPTLPPSPPGDGSAPVLVATSTGTMAHRPGCRAVAGKRDLRTVSVADGLKPCGMCRPTDRVAAQ